MSVVIDKSKQKIEEILLELGYELVDIEYKKTQLKDPELILIVEKTSQEPVTLDDCVLINDKLDKPLDDIDPTNGEPYNLTIYSRPSNYKFVREKDFERSIEKDIDISFYKKNENFNDKKITAKLLSFNNEEIQIEYKNEKYKILRTEIALIRQTIVF